MPESKSKPGNGQHASVICNFHSPFGKYTRITKIRCMSFGILEVRILRELMPSLPRYSQPLHLPEIFSTIVALANRSIQTSLMEIQGKLKSWDQNLYSMSLCPLHLTLYLSTKLKHDCWLLFGNLLLPCPKHS